MRARAVFLLASLAACSGGSSVTVELRKPSSAAFDPYASPTALAKVRITIDGDQQYDDAATDLGDARLTESSVTFDDYPSDRVVAVRAEGFDEVGNLVAFGAAEGVRVDGDTRVPLAFRRNLAFVTHRANARQPKAARLVYVIDVASRTYASSIALPGTSPEGRGVSSRGGESVLVAYGDGGRGFVGLLSTDTGEWTSVPLPRPQDLALAAPGHAVAVAAGGGAVTLFDVDAKSVLKEFSIGGSVLDGAISADGARAVFALDVSPSILLVDLGEQCTKTLEEGRCLRALDVLPGAAGIALASDGHTAFVTSSRERSVVAIDLATTKTTPLENGFAAPVRAAAYSSEIQAVLALEAGQGTTPRVLTYVVPTRGGLPLDVATPTRDNPSDIAADPSGRRLIVVAAGTSTASAGLSVIETSYDSRELKVDLPIGSTGLYPFDPSDTFGQGDFVAHQRYQPSKVGILYGR